MENSPSNHNIFNVNWAILHFVGVIDEVALLFPCGQNMLLCYMGGGGSEGLLCIPILHCSGHLDLITIKACLIINIQSVIVNRPHHTKSLFQFGFTIVYGRKQ